MKFEIYRGDTLTEAAELLERRGNLQMPADQRAELLRDNTRWLYVGVTRAGLTLFIPLISQLPAYLRRWAPPLRDGML